LKRVILSDNQYNMHYSVDSPGFRVDPSASGAPTLAIDTGKGPVYLHSARDPRREGESFAKKIPEKEHVLIILGLGLGYHLLSLRERRDRYPALIIVERLPGMDRELIGKDADFLAKANNCHILSGLDTGNVESSVKEILGDVEGEGYTLLEHPASFRAFPEYYREIRDRLKEVIEGAASNRLTRHHMGRWYLRNGFKNLEVIHGERPVAALEGLAEGTPALVCSSGPGLDRVLDRAVRHRDRFLLLAVDSALGPVHARGMEADIVVTVDPQPWVREHYFSTRKSRAALVRSLTATRGQEMPSPVFLSLNTHPLSQVLDHLYPGIIGNIDSGTGSVSGDALSLARLLGCRPLALAGQDFAFPSLEIYARDTAYQKRYRGFYQDRVRPVETWNADYVFKKSRAMREEGVFTRRSFLGYRSSMEAYLEGLPEGSVARVESRGLALKGTQALSFEEFIHDCGDSFEREAFQELLEGIEPLGTRVDLGKLQRFLNEKSIFEEMVTGSLGNRGKPDRMINLFNNILGVVE
jgi:hypothetical protein